MKRHILLGLIFVLVSFVGYSEAEVKFANEGKAGLRSNSIDRVLRLDDKEIDLSTAALLLSKQWNPDVAVGRYRAKIDNMALAIRERMARKHVGNEPRATQIINDYLYKELGFKAVPYADDPQDLFLDSVIDRRQGYCLSLSVLYISIGERLGLPLYGIVVPGHFFVRWDDGATRFNIEATSNGSNPPDSHYIEKFGITGKEPDSIYMQNLTNSQIIGCFYNNLGNLYQDINDIDEAARCLERAVEINPSLALGHTNLGNVYLKREWTSKAIGEYAMALKINDKDAKTHNNMGNAYMSLNKFREAAHEYEIAIKLDSNLPEAYRNLASAYRQNGSYESAAIILRKAMMSNPDDDELLVSLGDVYVSMRDYDHAITVLLKALHLKPNSAPVYQTLAYAYLQKGLVNDSVDAFKNAILYEPLNAELYYGLGQAYDKLGQFEEGISAYRQAISIKPNHIGAALNLGNAYQERKMYDEAIVQYKKAISVDPENAYLHYNLGVAYSRKELHREAAAAFKDSIKLKPQYGDAHLAIAMSYYMLKELESAKSHCERARELGLNIPADFEQALYPKAR